jgi:hypothetical protein
MQLIKRLILKVSGPMPPSARHALLIGSILILGVNLFYMIQSRPIEWHYRPLNCAFAVLLLVVYQVRQPPLIAFMLRGILIAWIVFFTFHFFPRQ